MAKKTSNNNQNLHLEASAEKTYASSEKKPIAPTHKRKGNGHKKSATKTAPQSANLKNTQKKTKEKIDTSNRQEQTDISAFYKSYPTQPRRIMSADEWMEQYFSSEQDHAADNTPALEDKPAKKQSQSQSKSKQSKTKQEHSATKSTQPKQARVDTTSDQVSAPVKSVKSTKPERASHPIPEGKLKIIPLGGLSEIGKNMTVIQYENDIVVIDCGLGFPEDDMPGIDLVIPDVTYLEENKDKIRAIVLTHGHEDHIGAIPYVLRNINPPIYGTNLTLGIVKNKLKEVTLPHQPRLNCVKAGDTVKLGSLSVEFIHVNHSIADACALAIKTPYGTIVHSGDFKLDLSPIDGEIMDLTRFGELGKEGVLMLMCESTNAERPGTTPSEKKVGASLEYIFTVQKEKRIVISTFSSNVHRVQQIIDVAARHGRKVAITGRSMLNIVGAAVELGYMHVPEGVLIDVTEIRRYSPHEVTLITTGSQGEPMSALYRMAFGEHREVRLGAGDVVVLSSSPIPGNEKLINRIVNELCKLGVQVIRDAAVEVHVSGHACQEEIKLLYALTKPKYFMPIHGEYKHMAANRELAMYMGMDPQNIFISDIGKVLEIDNRGAKWGGTVTAGKVLIDGYGVGDVGNIVLRDRILLSQDGVIIIVATVSSDGGYVMSGPDIVTRGFVYVRESEDLMEEMKAVAQKSIMSCLGGRYTDWFRIKTKIKDDMAKYISSKTKRKPMIIPMIMNV